MNSRLRYYLSKSTRYIVCNISTKSTAVRCKNAINVGVLNLADSVVVDSFGWFWYGMAEYLFYDRLMSLVT